MWRGESSKAKNYKHVHGGVNINTPNRSASPSTSMYNSITDINIFNYNRRIRENENGIKELNAKEIGVVCQVSEECIIGKFFKIEKINSQVLRLSEGGEFV